MQSKHNAEIITIGFLHIQKAFISGVTKSIFKNIQKSK